eukprot:CAMPEP_0206064226 /NCGR_PEP_ID=MMETSP1466-20131121/58626_1 /ASSEMBLY_ACC=CAM_ASM_001126 /TAXON_ID=44452 /ORGANISM="Pavlova gyrans, Strain CCMP608" /LENGTH=793 /DNA_ID=CAMNT_0053439599 /DNA_START=30 /DNA_END=2407 /DNA_ORIENTATION=+
MIRPALYWSLFLLASPCRVLCKLVIQSYDCIPCGESYCLSNLCSAGNVCGVAFVASQYKSRGWMVDMPMQCHPGPYTCTKDEDMGSLMCARGTCAFDAPCGRPRRGDIRLQPTELSQLLEQRLGQVPSSPPSGLLMLYGMQESDKWSLACADQGTSRTIVADVACRQLGRTHAEASKMVPLGPLLERLLSAFKGSPGGGTNDAVAVFSKELRALYGAGGGHLTVTAHSLHSCSARGDAPLPTTVTNCTGPQLTARGTCPRTDALHITCAADHLPEPERPRVEATTSCGSPGVSPVPPCDDSDPSGSDADAEREQCPSLFLPAPQRVAGGLYCVHYPMHGMLASADRERLLRARAAERLTDELNARAETGAAVDAETTRACEAAVSAGDLATIMSQCAAASGFAQPAAAAALAQAYANGANDAGARAAAEAAGIAGFLALQARTAPPLEDPLAGVNLSPVVCFLGAVDGQASGDSILQLAGAPANAGNATSCSDFATRAHCPGDRWAAALLPNGAYLCAGTAPPEPPPPAGLLPPAVELAAGIFDGAPDPFVLCRQTGPEVAGVPRCEPRAAPRLSPMVTNAVGVHLDPRPHAQPAAGADDAAGAGGGLLPSLSAAAGAVAEAGSTSCSGSALEPRLCGAGVFCPNLFNRTVCPAGAFCWQGSVVPAPCEADLLHGALLRLVRRSRVATALLGSAVPQSGAAACPAGSTAPPLRVDFVLLLAAALLVAAVAFTVYDWTRYARQAALHALGADSDIAQRSTAALYLELDALYAKSAAILAPGYPMPHGLGAAAAR